MANEPAPDAVTCIASLCPPGPGDPQDCDWPFCGCDPIANKVLAAVEESGRLVAADPFAAQAPAMLEALRHIAKHPYEDAVKRTRMIDTLLSQIEGARHG